MSRLIDISQYHNQGSVEGYVVDTKREQLGNFFTSNGISKQVANKYLHKFHTIAILKNMQVSRRGKGIGRKLLDQFIDQAYDEGAEAIFLVADVSEKNDFDLIQWYERYGFEKITKTSNSDYLMVLDEK